MIVTIVLPVMAIAYPTSLIDKVSSRLEKGTMVAQNNTFRAVVEGIPVPGGYKRITQKPHSFGHWLRAVKLKSDNTVYLYNGTPKRNQDAQFAVLDLPVGTKDLQQCADAVMRLRAEYLRSEGQVSRISFTDNAGVTYQCPPAPEQPAFERYLEKVYSFCGTISLQRQLKPVKEFSELQPGDVLIKGGSPGHAVMVIDVAVNAENEKVYMLAQSYMPAQSIHILKNPDNGRLSPWYSASGALTVINTPEWRFDRNQLRRW